MKKFLRNIIPVVSRIIPTPKFSEVTYYRHRQGKYLYYCMSEEFIKDELIDGKFVYAIEKILELFPKAIRISKTEFDCIHFFRPEIEVIEIADAKIMAEIDEDEYIDEHEETEDKNLIQE